MLLLFVVCYVSDDSKFPVLLVAVVAGAVVVIIIFVVVVVVVVVALRRRRRPASESRFYIMSNFDVCVFLFNERNDTVRVLNLVLLNTSDNSDLHSPLVAVPPSVPSTHHFHHSSQSSLITLSFQA